MSSTRKKIGVIVPSSNTTVESDFVRVLPENTSLHSSRMWVVATGMAVLERMNQDLESCSKQIGSAEVDVIAYACTSGSFVGGAGFDRKIRDQIMGWSGGIPTVPTSTAVLQALQLLGMKRISVVSPYPDDTNQSLSSYLESNGFSVTSLAGRGHKMNREIGAETPEAITKFAYDNLSANADGLFLSCTNWRAMEAVSILEEMTGKPVVTSNQATIWATFCALRRTGQMNAYGRLFTEHSNAYRLAA